MEPKTKLKREMSWLSLSLYGLGTVLGAGVYAAMGELAGVAQGSMLLSLVVAGVVAVITAMTYSALAAKYPVSAGSPYYVEKAFGVKWLSTLTGLLLVWSGVVVAATLLTGFHSYVVQMPGLEWVTLTGLSAAMVMLLGAVAVVGMKESAWMAGVITVVEVGGLLLVIGAAMMYDKAGETLMASMSSMPMVGGTTLLTGVMIAYFAYLGFDSMVTVSEEVKDPKKNVPKAIMVTMTVATVVYLGVALAMLSVLPVDELLSGKATLVEVFVNASGVTVPVLAYVGGVAIVNGVLSQMVMSSRVLYGMSEKKELPAVLQLSRLSKTQTPYVTIAVAMVAVMALVVLASLNGEGLGQLIGGVVAIYVAMFTIVQSAAIRLILKKELKLNITIPVVGLVVNGVMLAHYLQGLLG